MVAIASHHAILGFPILNLKSYFWRTWIALQFFSIAGVAKIYSSLQVLV
jgi:hypothetical protein